MSSSISRRRCAGLLRTQLATTIRGTQHIMRAMAQAGVARIVVASSIAVYDYSQGKAFSRLDESSPLESRPEFRDAYCQTKLRQEETVHRLAVEYRLNWLILRPGVVYGTRRLWTARLGLAISPHWWLLTGTRAPLPLTFVENCAEAFILGAERDDVQGEVLNVVDDDVLVQGAYARRIRSLSDPRPRIVPLPQTMFRLVASIAQMINLVFFRGRRLRGGLLSPRQLAARCAARRYSNTRLKEVLGWKPIRSLEAAFQSITEDYGDRLE